MSQRIERVNELIKQELGRFIMKEIELPPSSLVTITNAETTPDLKMAKVYVSIFPDKLRGTILEKLNKNSRRLYELLKAELNMKFIPNLHFVIDEQELFAKEIDQLLDGIKQE